jgi:hypothetical protein
LHAIKGRQKISDLISGELPNEIIKVCKLSLHINSYPQVLIKCSPHLHHAKNVHKVINTNKMLKQHIVPHLSEPKYTTLKDSTKQNSIKINSMMRDLVTYINELVDDQIQMRTCIPLTSELHDFYVQLMGRDVDEEASASVIEDDENASRYEKSIQRFLMPKRKLRGKIVVSAFPSLSLSLSQSLSLFYYIYAELVKGKLKFY